MEQVYKRRKVECFSKVIESVTSNNEILFVYIMTSQYSFFPYLWLQNGMVTKEKQFYFCHDLSCFNEGDFNGIILLS